MKHLKTFESFVNESYSDAAAYKAVVDILKTLHGFSNKLKFRVQDVNGIYNIVYDDPEGLTADCLKDLKDRRFWNTEFAPTTGRFGAGRININFLKSAQDILNIVAFDDRNWKPGKFNESAVNEKRRIGFFGLRAMDLLNKITAMSYYHTVKKGEKARVLVDGKRYWVTDLQELEKDPRAKTVIVTDWKGEEVEFEISEIQEIEMG